MVHFFATTSCKPIHNVKDSPIMRRPPSRQATYSNSSNGSVMESPIMRRPPSRQASYSNSSSGSVTDSPIMRRPPSRQATYSNSSTGSNRQSIPRTLSNRTDESHSDRQERFRGMASPSRQNDFDNGNEISACYMFSPVVPSRKASVKTKIIFKKDSTA
jgi:hypothetical protein